MFIHGKEDKYVPYNNIHILYSAACGKKDKLSVPDAFHAISAVEHPDLYFKKVDEFLEQYMN